MFIVLITVSEADKFRREQKFLSGQSGVGSGAVVDGCCVSTSKRQHNINSYTTQAVD